MDFDGSAWISVASNLVRARARESPAVRACVERFSESSVNRNATFVAMNLVLSDADLVRVFA